MVHVFLYVPNLIGYMRVISALVSTVYALNDPWKFVWIYTFSMGLDAIDGVAARRLNQTSRFGAVLDMVTDRFSTAMLLAILSQLYSQHVSLFLCLMVLDVASHWCQMYASLLEGDSHKSAVKNPILRFYYSFPILFLVCVFNEACLLGLYVLHFTTGPEMFGVHIYTAGFYFCLPWMCFKQLTSVVQLVEASCKLAAYDNPKNNKD